VIKLTIDYGWAGCTEEHEIDEFEEDTPDDVIERWVQEFVQDEIWNKVSWDWERVEEDE
jgi:hypothetical protein